MNLMENKTKWIIFWLFFIIGIIIAGCQSMKPSYSSNNIDTTSIIQPDTFVLNQQNIYYQIVRNNIKHPKIVLKQAILETGWFKSRLCKQNNNLFGFHNGKSYMKFKSYNDCIKYYAHWQKSRYDNTNYYKFLEDCNYASDTNYVSILKKIKVNV
jgi:hypothetical protein